MQPSANDINVVLFVHFVGLAYDFAGDGDLAESQSHYFGISSKSEAENNTFGSSFSSNRNFRRN